MNHHVSFLLGSLIVAVSCASGSESVPASKVAPDIAKVRQMLGSLLTEKAETDMMEILDDDTLRLFSKDAEFVVKVEDGALVVTEYGIEGKTLRAQRGSYRQVAGRDVWVDDAGWVARSRSRIPAEVKKESLQKVRERIVDNLMDNADMPNARLTMKPCGSIWCMSEDRIDLGIWYEGTYPDGKAYRDVMSCSFQYRDGKWHLVMMDC